MQGSTFSLVGARGREYLSEYLSEGEWAPVLEATRRDPRPEVQTFALVLAHTGCRISEALAIRHDVTLVAGVRVRRCAARGALPFFGWTRSRLGPGSRPGANAGGLECASHTRGGGDRMRSAGPWVTCVLLFGLAASAPAAAQSGRPPARVEVDAVREEPIAQTMPVVGRVVPREHGTVAATIGGPVAEVAVRVGDRVEAGDVLIVLARDLPAARLAQRRADESLEAARVRTAEAEVDLVRQELERLEKLKDSAAFPKAAFEDKRQELVRRRSRVREAAAALARARVQREMAEIELARTTVRAPYAGVVTARQAAPGGYLKAGDPVATLVDDERLEVEADVPSDRLAGLFPGLEVTIELDGGSVHRATVRAIVPDENPLTRTRPVRFTPEFAPDLEPGPEPGLEPGPEPGIEPSPVTGLELGLAPGLAPGGGSARPAANQSVVVRIPVAGPGIAASVHKDAVVSRGGRSLVYVATGTAEDARAQVRPIRLGESVGSRFVVVDGLRAGELVVVRGNERLNPGQAIRYRPEGAAPAPGSRPGPASGPIARSEAGPRKPVVGPGAANGPAPGPGAAARPGAGPGSGPRSGAGS